MGIESPENGPKKNFYGDEVVFEVDTHTESLMKEAGVTFVEDSDQIAILDKETGYESTRVFYPDSPNGIRVRKVVFEAEQDDVYIYTYTQAAVVKSVLIKDGKAMGMTDKEVAWIKYNNTDEWIELSEPDAENFDPSNN